MGGTHAEFCLPRKKAANNWRSAHSYRGSASMLPGPFDPQNSLSSRRVLYAFARPDDGHQCLVEILDPHGSGFVFLVPVVTEIYRLNMPTQSAPLRTGDAPNKSGSESLSPLFYSPRLNIDPARGRPAVRLHRLELPVGFAGWWRSFLWAMWQQPVVA